jgi:ribosome maturation factor RimP
LTKEEVIQKLEELISGCLAVLGLEFIELIYRFEGKRLVLRVLADKPQGGINLEECAAACRQLKNLLEEKNIIENDYVLEVSSPGLDRPLKRKNDFLRCLNKEAVFFLNGPVNGRIQWQGEICKADETSVFIRVLGESLEIPLTKINKAQLVIL